MAALAGSLAAVGTMQADSHAAIQHVTGSPVTAKLSDGASYEVNWDIDGSGSSDMKFWVSTFTSSSGTISGIGGYISASVANDGSRFNFLLDGSGDIIRLSASQKVGPTNASDAIASGTFSSGSGQFLTRQIYGSTFHVRLGTLANGSDPSVLLQEGDNYLGFKFEDDNGDSHYGWANLNIDLDLADPALSVTEWAWEDTPDTQIHVGTTDSGGGPVVPEPSSLALLAMGAGGLFSYRARQKKRSAEVTV